MEPELYAEVADYLRCADAAVTAAGKELATVKQAADMQKTASAALPAKIAAAVEELIKHKRIAPEDREKAAAALQDHGRTVDVLTNTADTTRSIAPKEPGRPAGMGKKASADGRAPAPYAAARFNKAPDEADLQLLQDMRN